MTPKTYRIVMRLWPLACGLIIGGMLGGIMQSFQMFALFGTIAWAYFHFDPFGLPGLPKGAVAVGGLAPTLNDDDFWLLREDEENYEASLYSGTGPYGDTFHHHDITKDD